MKKETLSQFLKRHGAEAGDLFICKEVEDEKKELTCIRIDLSHLGGYYEDRYTGRQFLSVIGLDGQAKPALYEYPKKVTLRDLREATLASAKAYSYGACYRRLDGYIRIDYTPFSNINEEVTALYKANEKTGKLDEIDVQDFLEGKV